MNAQFNSMARQQRLGVLATALGLILAAQLYAQTFTILHDFAPGDYSPSGAYTNIDGSDPGSLVVLDNMLCGTTWTGGTSGNGTLFNVNLDGTAFSIPLAFPTPAAGGLTSSNGTFYGTTGKGGNLGNGSVFRVNANGTGFATLYSFSGGADGGYPYAGLIGDAAGNLYGTTWVGGASGLGTVFKLDKNGNQTVLHSFAGGTDGASPYAGLILDTAGNLYGTTVYGGTSNRGTVFKLDQNGNETVLHSFSYADGAYPYGGLIRDSAGHLFGTTTYGGAGDGSGTAFELIP